MHIFTKRFVTLILCAACLCASQSFAANLFNTSGDDEFLQARASYDPDIRGQTFKQKTCLDSQASFRHQAKVDRDFWGI